VLRRIFGPRREEGKRPLGDIGIVGKVILEWILEK
jgi:hypothetical protein